jgi:DNA-binding transcriptional LysR family regulator
MVVARIGPDMMLAIVGAPSYLTHHSPPKKPQDLTRHDYCINLWLPIRDAAFSWELRKGRRELQVRDGQLVFNSVYQMVEAALAGFGLAYVPKDLVAPVAAGRLACVLGELHPTFTGFHVYYSSRRQSSRAVALVVETLKAGEDNGYDGIPLEQRPARHSQPALTLLRFFVNG